MTDKFIEALDHAEPIGSISHGGKEVGYIYKVRVECDRETKTAKLHEDELEAWLASRDRYNKRKRRCSVRIKPKNNVRVVWSCVKYVARFDPSAPAKAFEETDRLFPTFGRVLGAIDRAGLAYDHKPVEFLYWRNR